MNLVRRWTPGPRKLKVTYVSSIDFPFSLIDTEAFFFVAELSEEVDDLVKDDPRAYAANDGISDLDKAALGWSKKVHVHANDHLIGGIGIWGDSAVYNTRDSIVLILFNILTGLCATPHRIWLACLSKKQLCMI